MKIIAVIPSRYKSTRFPGKPLADICGKPMIWWVYNQALKVKQFDKIYVATDDERIKDVCDKNNMNVIMTNTEHPTGTDRVGEVAEKIKADLYINIQGDEPLIEPETIEKAILPFYDDEKLLLTNLMTKIKNPVDVVNCTIPKVITNKDGYGVYLTRSTAPYPKGRINYDYYKQVCVYGFKPEALKFFCEYGKRYGKAKIEAIEDIEILRFIENAYRIKFIKVETESIAVDTVKDLERVKVIMQRKYYK